MREERITNLSVSWPVEAIAYMTGTSPLLYLRPKRHRFKFLKKRERGNFRTSIAQNHGALRRVMRR